MPNLATTALRREGYINVRLSEVAFVFRDLILENQVITPSLPSKFANHPMILVAIFEPVRQDDIGRNVTLQLLEASLQRFELSRKISVGISVENDLHVNGSAQQRAGAASSLHSALTWSAQNDPGDLDLRITAQEIQDRPTTADFQIVAVCA